MSPPSSSKEITRALRARTTTSASSSNSNSAKSQQSRSTTKQYPYRESRARKSLKFESERISNTRPIQDESTIGEESQTFFKATVTAHNSVFWSNPPPPVADPFILPIGGIFPLSCESTLSSTSSYRRSERLIRKTQNETTQSDTDSGLEPTPPSSQEETYVPLNSSLLFDQNSIHSDYGTSSENSFSENPMKWKLRQRDKACSPKRTRHDLSPGYMSDLEIDDDVDVSPKTEPQPWFSDDEHETEKNDTMVLVIQESTDKPWEEIITEESMETEGTTSYLNISDLNSSDPVEVKWLQSEGVHVVIPLKGFEHPLDEVENIEENQSEDTLLCSRIPPKRSRLLPLPPKPKHPFQITTDVGSRILQESFRRQGLRVILASDIVSLKPLGTKFCQLYPAIVSIPLNEIPGIGDEVYCLYTDQLITEDFLRSDPTLHWNPLPHKQITVEKDRISFETFIFHSYVVVIRERPIEAQKPIRARIGGKLYVPEIPWVEIIFPKGLLNQEINAKAYVFLDTELSVPEYICSKEAQNLALASPIVMLEPHGYDFLPNLVTVELPIPDYDEILAKFGPSAKLTIWQSSTRQSEPTSWEVLNVSYSLRKVKHLGNQPQTVISFRVSHFSFFRVVWDLISESLYNVGVGMSSFVSFVSFSMKCQANMEEADDNRFGLEVTCFRSDKRFSEIQNTNYRFKVGASTKPKLVRPGRILVKLKSSYFDADEDAGEDPELTKEECDFRGRDFEVQYCCKFKGDKSIDRGPFGKVIVNRGKPDGRPGEMLFEFNLQKAGHECERTPGAENDRWSQFALLELATGLFIMDGDNWKLFARHIGFTKEEIKKNFRHAPSPFTAIVQMYQHRGGTPEEFVQALYAVNREIKINGGVSPSTQSRSSTCSSGRGSLSYMDKYKFGSDSDTSGTQISQDSGMSGVTTKKRSNSSVNKSNSSSSNKTKRRKIHGRFEKERNGLKDSSEGPEPDSTTEDDELQNPIDKEEVDGISALLADQAKSESNSSIFRRNDQTRLEDSFLHEVSRYMDGLNWKSLGRTLGLDEPILLNIETKHRLVGIRELFYQMLLHWKEKHPKRCTFGTLYGALRKEGMNSVAKAMMTIRKND